MAHTIDIDVVDIRVSELNHSMIPIVNRPNPCKGYSADAYEVRMLIQMASYRVYESGTDTIITGENFYVYFPEEQPGGGSTSYSLLTGKPAIDNHTLESGNNTSSDLGLQTELSAEQLGAVNSGITSDDVTQIETNKNNISTIQQTIGDINTVLEGVL